MTPGPFSGGRARYLTEAGVSPPRRANRGRPLLIVVFLCAMCLALSTCCGSPGGAPQAETDLLPEVLAGLLSKPVLPELRVECGERSVAGIRGGYRWTLDGDLKQLDEVWPPPTPSGRLLVSPGEEVVFTITLPAGSPAVTATDKGISARLEVWGDSAASSERLIGPLHSTTCELRGTSVSSTRVSWRMPDHLARWVRGNSFLAKLTVEWGDEGIFPWVSFYWNLEAAEKGVADAVLEAARRYFDAMWKRDEEALTEVSPGWREDRPEGVPLPSPLRAYLPGPRDSILWKSPAQEYRLASRPSFLVESVHSSSSGPYATCRAEYEVDVKDRHSGKKERQVVREEIRLERADGGGWKVVGASRTPVSVATKDARDADGKGTVLPSVASRAEHLCTIVQVGPFEDVRSPYYGQKWSDDGEWFAFVGSAGGMNGIWAVDRGGSRLVSLVGLEGTELELLDWVPGQHKVRFLAYGYHSRGPHADKTGYWVGEVELDTRELRDIAFIRYPMVHFPMDVHVPEGRSHLVFRHKTDLWRIDMETGETVKLADDVPYGDGLIPFRYSTSGWFAVSPQISLSDQPGFKVYDLKTGNMTDVSLPDRGAEGLWVWFERWTPKEEAMVLVCRSDEVNQGDDWSYPAGATLVRLYDPVGSMLEEILPPQDDPENRIGPTAWNDDGSALAMAVGCLSEPSLTHPFGKLQMRHRARAIYVWTRSDGTLRKVADISGEIESLSWSEEGEAIEAWFRVSDDHEVEFQNGVRFGLDGVRMEIQRILPYRASEVTVGSSEDLVLVKRVSSAGGWTLAVRPGTGDRVETVVNDTGPVWLDEPVMSPGAFAVSGDIRDEFGESAHWVYLVVKAHP